MTDAKKMALLACEALEDKKASDIKVIVTRYRQWRIM